MKKGRISRFSHCPTSILRNCKVVIGADVRKQKFHDILQNIDTGLLQLWARGNLCQIGKALLGGYLSCSRLLSANAHADSQNVIDYLATIVLEALELWPFTLDILKIMGMLGKAVLDTVYSLTFSSLCSFFPKRCRAAAANASGHPFRLRHRLEIRLR